MCPLIAAAIAGGRFRTKEERHLLVDSAPTNSDGKVCVRFMRSNDALFAYPQFFLNYDLVDVLKFCIDQKVIKPSMTITFVDGDGDREEKSLLYLAVQKDSTNCFLYLLSLPGTDINAISWSREAQHGRDHENIIHSCINTDRIRPSYLEAVIAHSKVDLDARTSSDETAFYKGCWLFKMGFQTVAKLRLLVEAGADLRLMLDNSLSDIDARLGTLRMMASRAQDNELEAELELLQKEILEHLDERDWQDTT